MFTVTIEEAQAQLPQLIEQLRRGGEIVITCGQVPVARLIADSIPERPPRRLGTMKGSVRYMDPDFDAELDDFKEYMG